MENEIRDVNVVSRDTFDDPENWPYPWYVEFPNGGSFGFLNEEEACALQIAYRESVGLDAGTGELISS